MASLTVHSHTEAGGKPVNEDFILLRRHPASHDSYLCFLADGQGGRSHGAEASRKACEAAWELASGLSVEHLREGLRWVSILQQVDAQVGSTGGYTTLIALIVGPGFAVGASSGDSKIYYAKSGPVTDLTEWTSQQRKNPPVGSGGADFVPFEFENLTGGRVLIASDGVWKYCGYEALRKSFESPIAEVSQALKQAIFQRSGPHLPDDFSVLVVDG